MKSLDGIQGPEYFGTGCVFDRRALYGYDPQISKRSSKFDKNLEEYDGSEIFDLEHMEEILKILDLDHNEVELKRYDELEDPSLMSQESLMKRFGQSPIFTASTLRDTNGVVEGTNAMKAAIHVICCDYEVKTEWGKEVLEFVAICFTLPFNC